MLRVEELQPKSLARQGYVRVAISFLLVFLVACSNDDLMSLLESGEEVGFAEDYLESLRLKDLPYLKENAHEDLREIVSDKKLNEIAGYFPAGDPLNTHLIGSMVRVTNGEWSAGYTFEYQFSEGWAVAVVNLKKEGEGLWVTAFSVEQTPDSQEALNAFSLQGKPISHYVILGFAALISIFILVTAIVCVRTPLPRRKWLWLLFILFGFGKISLNWTTGVFAVHPLFFLLFGSSISSMGPNAPWIIATTVPLGAMWFWIERTSLMADAHSSVDE